MRRLSVLSGPLLGYVILAILGTLFAQDRELVPERDWTSVDGKVMRASLIGFEKGQGQFRTPEGRRFVIPDERLSYRDQVEVFAARLRSEYEVSYSADINTDFYYSKHIPASRRSEKKYSYIGFGPGRFNLAIALIEPGVDLGRHKEIVLRGREGGKDVVYPVRETDIRRFTRNGSEQVFIRLSFVPGQNEDLLESIEGALAASSLTFVARGGNLEERVLAFDETECNGLREMLQAYRHASILIREGFLKRDRLVDQAIDAAGKSVPNGSDGDPLEPFRKNLSQRKYGTLQWKEQLVDGIGFLGADVVVRQGDGEIVKIPFGEIEGEGRRRLFEKRLEEAYGKSRYESSAGVAVFFHPDWDSQRMNYSRSILLTLNQKGEYLLRLFAWTGSFGGASVKEIFVRGDAQEKPFPVECRRDDSHSRERTDGTRNTLVGCYLDVKGSEAAMELLGSKSIQFRIRSDQNQDVSVTLQEEERDITLESVALYWWSRQL